MKYLITIALIIGTVVLVKSGALDEVANKLDAMSHTRIHHTYSTENGAIASIFNVNGTFTVDAVWSGSETEAKQFLEMAQRVILKMRWANSSEFQARVSKVYTSIGFKSVVVNLRFS